jgi:hypothetical protein
MDAARLAVKLRADAVWLASLGLSEEGQVFFSRLLVESCEYLVKVMQILPEFGPRADTEVLARLSNLSDQVRQILDRMPRTVRQDAQDEDRGFLQSYLAFISEDLDSLEMIGVDTHDRASRAKLSVAYLSLTVSSGPEDTSRERTREARWHSAEVPSVSAKRSRVETALGANRLSVIRGQAGSGKTTMLQWLGVTASRSGFADDLVAWNDLIPILITLRHLDNGPFPAPSELLQASTPAIAAVQPEGWMTRQLRSGRVLLLVDGVDEIGVARRRSVATWLRQLVNVYDLHIVVTSRPAAVPEDWLSDVGFKSVMLEPMNADDVRVFVRQWHDAVWHAGRSRDWEIDRTALDRAERAMLGQFEARPHLRSLATTPLLCALLCALNISRKGLLPRDRMDVYRAALDMLDRRDAERQIQSASTKDLSPRQRQYLLQGLAWRLAERAKSEMAKGKATAWIESRLQRLPVSSELPEASQVLADLIARSGVIREPVVGRIDFIHRSFLEFLAAKEAAEEDHTDLLIDKAHLDHWREIIVMTAGHGGSGLQEELIKGILDRSQAEPLRTRTFSLLAVACLETATSLSERLRDRLRLCIDAVLPPRNLGEARSLASAGEFILRHLPHSLEGISANEAAAVVRTAVYVGGDEAAACLKRYTSDGRLAVVSQLVQGWDYFDAEIYAAEVLAESPLLNGYLEVADTRQLEATRHLRGLKQLTAVVSDDGIGRVRAVPALTTVVLQAPIGRSLSTAKLSSLRGLSSLTSLVFESPISPDVMSHLYGMKELRVLHAQFSRSPDSLRFVENLPKLQSLGLKSLQNVQDLSALRGLRSLRELSLWHLNPDADLATEGLAESIADLTLVEFYGDGVAEKVSVMRELRRLRVLQCDGLRSVEPLVSLELRELWLRDCDKLTDLGSIGSISTLETLALIDCADGDLSFLSSLTGLTTLFLRTDSPFDLDVLGERTRLLKVYLVGGQRLDAGSGGQQRNVQIRRMWNATPTWHYRDGWTFARHAARSTP